MTGPGESPRLCPQAVKTLLDSLEQLSVCQGLTVSQVAVRCVLAGRIPVFPLYSREVVNTYAKLEAEQTRGPVSKA